MYYIWLCEFLSEVNASASLVDVIFWQVKTSSLNSGETETKVISLTPQKFKTSGLSDACPFWNVISSKMKHVSIVALVPSGGTFVLECREMMSNNSPQKILP
jgi:hypothetical protein